MNNLKKNLLSRIIFKDDEGVFLLHQNSLVSLRSCFSPLGDSVTNSAETLSTLHLGFLIIYSLFSMLLVVVPDLGLAHCFWSGFLLIMARNQSLGSQATPRTLSSSLLTPCWNTLMLLCCSVLCFSTVDNEAKLSMISAGAPWTLNAQLLIPTITALFLR